MRIEPTPQRADSGAAATLAPRIERSRQEGG
jgi:hypothetical protein